MAEYPPGSIGSQSTAPGGSSPGGLLDHGAELLASVLEYLQARLALIGIEAKEALLHFAIIIGLLVFSIGLLVFGYLFLCVSLCVLIALAFGISPGWVILGLAVLHFVIAATAVIVGVIRLKAGVFSATLAELRKDQQWLNQKKN
jgi:uncharacterized membrane protein YqjE